MNSLLSLKNITKRYDAEKLILDRLSLDVPNGQAVFLVGPNGSGKTTLVKIILGLLPPNDGKVLYKGDLITQPYDNTIKKQFGFVPDEPLFIEYLTAMENLNYYCALYKKDWTPLQLEKLIQSHGLKNNNNNLVNDYSRGMRQKLSLCFLDIVDPDLVLMDEPTIGLDIPGIKYLREYIYTLKQSGKALLITSHDMAFCQSAADTIYLLNNGQAERLEEDSEGIDMISQIEKGIMDSGLTNK